MAQSQVQVQKQEQALRQTQAITQQQMLQSHLVELPINQLLERINTEMDDNPALEAEPQGEPLAETGEQADFGPDGEAHDDDYDAEHYTPSAAFGNYIGEAKAKQIVEQRAGTTGTYREFKLERDDGRMVYEGELRSGWTEYEFTIDALTGTVLEWEVDH